MQTKIIKISSDKPESTPIAAAAKIIKAGGTVAFPTETVYGIGANALSDKAVKKIFAVKGRPSDNPMIVHIADMRDIHNLSIEVSPPALKLTKKFWPGPLTIILKKSKIVPASVTANLDTVAIRMPSHPIALALIRASKVPIAAPSANLSGKPSATTAGHVIDDLEGKVDAIIDGGESDMGLESTVIAMTEKIPVLLRPGKITAEDLRNTIGKIRIHPAVTAKRPISVARSPGMKYKHYSPKATLILVTGNKRAGKISDLLETYTSAGKKVGIIAEKNNNYSADAVSIFLKPEVYARNLFKTLREFDSKNIDIIIAEGISEKKLGLAVMNRLKKASTRIVKT